MGMVLEICQCGIVLTMNLPGVEVWNALTNYECDCRSIFGSVFIIPGIPPVYKRLVLSYCLTPAYRRAIHSVRSTEIAAISSLALRPRHAWLARINSV